MRVRCIRIPGPVDGAEAASSPWLKLHREYVVASLHAKTGSRTILQIVDESGSLSVWGSENFISVDQSLPSNWVANLDARNLLELGPAAWMATGFWESYYDDDDPSAIGAVESELAVILNEAGA